MKTVAMNPKIEYTAPKLYSPHRLCDALAVNKNDIDFELQSNEQFIVHKNHLKADTVQITNAKTGETLAQASRRGRKYGIVNAAQPMPLCKTLKLPLIHKKLVIIPKDPWESLIMKALRQLGKARF